MKLNPGLIFTALYGFCAATFFGAMLFDLVVLYPNVFAAIPSSLELTSDFLSVANPGTLFPRVGQATFVTGVLAVISNLGVPRARNILLLSLVILFGGTYLITALFFSPRNEILFLEGVARHSVETLQTRRARVLAGQLGTGGCRLYRPLAGDGGAAYRAQASCLERGLALPMPLPSRKGVLASRLEFCRAPYCIYEARAKGAEGL